MDQLDAWAARGRIATAVKNVQETIEPLTAAGKELIEALAEAQRLKLWQKAPDPAANHQGVRIVPIPTSDDELDRALIERVDKRIADLEADLELFQQLRARLAENIPQPPEPCRCDGTGTYTVVIPLADAVLIDDRPCPAGCPPASPQQTPDAPGGNP